MKHPPRSLHPEFVSVCGRASSRRKGSVLLVTLLVTSLLLMVALALVAMVRMELSAITAHQDLMRARANARLGMQMGLARLQETVGPDSRITAPAGLFDTEPNTPETVGLRHPWLTGVWKARSEALGETPDYGIQEPFLQWLVSTGDDDILTHIDFPVNGSLPNQVPMVGTSAPESGSAPGSNVVAGKIPTEAGAFAWWVGDENMKARINLSDDLDREQAASTAELLSAFASPGVHGVRALEDFDTFPTNSWRTDRLFSMRSLDLLPEPEGLRLGEVFHHLTPYSESVLADVTRGALRKDLSLYLERQDINWLEGWGRPAGRTVPPQGPLGPNGDFALSPPREYDVVAWKFLHHWYNMHRRQIGSGENHPIAHMQNHIPLDPVSNPKWNSGVMRITPVLVRIQMLFSYHAIRTSGEPASEDEEEEATWDLYINLFPVVMLWNPHNVGMEDVSYSIWTHTLPLEHTVYLEGNKVELSGQGTTGGIFNWGHPAGTLEFQWGVNPSERIQLGPGEAKLYIPGGTTPSDVGWRGAAFQMREGAPQWSSQNFGYAHKVGTVTGHPRDRIEIATAGDSLHTSGREFADWPTTFGFRTEARAAHDDGHSHRFRQQMFSGNVSWRREVDQGNPVASFISRENFKSRTLAAMQNLPSPFIHLDLRLKALDEAQLPNKTWLHNIPSHPYAASTSTSRHRQLGVGEQTTFFAHPYTVTFDQLSTAAGVFPDRPYFGSSYSAGGLTSLVDQEIPLVPLTSLAQLQNMPLYPIEGLNWNNYYYQNFAIGNSFALPGLSPAEIKRHSFPFYLGRYFPWQGGDIAGTLYANRNWFNNDEYTIDAAPASIIDRGYAANHLLFDSYFFSSMAAQQGPIFQGYGTERGLGEVVEDFFTGRTALPNRAYQPHLPEGTSPDARIDTLVSATGAVRADAYRKSAGYLMTAGGFNVNSTSVPAWTAMLAASHLKRPIIMENGRLRQQEEANFVVSRFTVPTGPAADNETGAAAEARRWQGYRELTAEEIRQLAAAMVEEVKRRGPFRSLGEFVNRRLTSDEDLAVYGALQAALENPNVDINKNYRNEVLTASDVGAANYPFERAATGPRHQGTPAYISQADILNALAPVINVRSDTFVIRGYGEIPGPNGTIAGKVYCEAVVQRVPGYVDASDAPEVPHEALTSDVNRAFGRKFIIKSFRYLEPSEIHALEN